MNHQRNIITLLLLALLGSACQRELIDPNVGVNDVLTLTASSQELRLEERFWDNRLSFAWTTGSNQGTGAAIFYTLEVFSAGQADAPLLTLVQREQAVFTASIDHGTLNDRLLAEGLVPGTAYELTARVTATLAHDGEAPQTSEVAMTVTPYRPVTTELYLLGSATAAGNDVTQAVALEPVSGRRGTFRYVGALQPGQFKFAVSRAACLCQDFYLRDPADAGRLRYSAGGVGDDTQWEITEAGRYVLTVDLLAGTLELGLSTEPPYGSLYVVGDASPSGWDIAAPQAFAQDPSDPFVFTFVGEFTAGEFKISTFTGDWCDGDWLNAAEAGQSIADPSFIITQGCQGPDHKWVLSSAEAGVYEVKVDFRDNTLTIEPTTISQEVVQGGDMSDPTAWTIYGVGWDDATVIEFENDELFFRDNPNNTYCNALAFQAITVEAGNYQLSAQVRGGGMDASWLELFISQTAPQEGTDYSDGRYLGILPGDGCGVSSFDGALADLACAGSGVGANGVVSFPQSATYYLVFKSGTFDGTLGPNGVALDEVQLVKL